MADIIIFYELPERELNNANLLKAEFERRGYSVEIKDYWNYHELVFPIKEKPKLVISHSGYDNSDLERFTARFKPKIDKMLNMRYEQVIADRILNSTLHYPREYMKNMSFICWSEHIKEEMMKQGIPERNLPVTGDIKTDFSNEMFDSFYKTKEELSEEFGLDSQKEWVLFISSFTFSEHDTDKRLIRMNNNLEDGKYMQKWDIESKKIIMAWVKKFLKDHPEKEFIYRPHPAEDKVVTEDVNMDTLEKEYPNFHYIGKYAVQEWIRPCDYLNTCLSTSIIDVYLLKKQCNILRPVPLNPEFDNPLLLHADSIDSYEEFEKGNTIKSDKPFPISDEYVNKYYYFGDKLVYESICDYAEKMIADDSFKSNLYPTNPLFSRLKFIIKKSLTMPKGIPTVFKSAIKNKSIHKSEMKSIDINAEKINKIIKGK